MWIIRKMDSGCYWVNRPGSRKAYTNKRENALRFDTEEEAQKDCCGNEQPERF